MSLGVTNRPVNFSYRYEREGYIAGYIHWRTRSMCYASELDIQAIKHQLEKTAPLPTTIRSTEYICWANKLKNVYNWKERVSRQSPNIVIDLPSLLHEALEAWERDGREAHPNDNEIACLKVMTKYIQNQTSKSKINIYPEVIWRAYCEADLLGIDDYEYDYSPSDYIRWGTPLKRRYDWDIHTFSTAIWVQIQNARKVWQKRGLDEPIDTMIRPPVKITPTSPKQTGVHIMQRPFFSEVDIQDQGNDLQDEETSISRRCDFCGKEMVIPNNTGDMLHRLSTNGFFCSFCVRHDFHTKKKRHVLILTLRGLIGYLFHFCYFGKKPRLYLTQIHDLINNHVKVGRLNPLFVYDAETFCWFVDFAKIGKSKKKIPMEQAIRTVNEMISAFNPYDHIKDFKSHILAERYREAVTDFYKSRYRPEGKQICSPTLSGCATDMREQATGTGTTTTTKKVDIKVYRDFMPQDCKPHTRR